MAIKMKVYEVDKTIILGEAVAEGNVITGVRSSRRSFDEDYIDWLKQSAAGTLITATLSAGVSMVAYDLTDEQLMTQATLDAQWALAETRKDGWLKAKVFDALKRS